MKKIISLMICVMLLFTMAMPAHAEDTDPSQATEHVCVWDEGVVTMEATCNTDGEKVYGCTGCESTKTEIIPATGLHEFETGTKIDEDTHEAVCITCGSPIVGNHVWDEGTVTKEATCQEDGIRTHYCKICDDDHTQTIAKTGHSYGDWIKTESEHSRVCNCGAEEKGNHTFTENITKPATCKEAGTKTLTCSACGFSKTEVIPTTKEHTYGNWTAAQKGHVRICTVCENEDKADHIYDDSCDAECNVCKAKRTVTHDFTKTWSSDFNNHWHECTKCGEKKDIAKHTPGTAATEEKAQVCTVCEYVIAPKKEHKHTFDNKWTKDEVGHWHECTGKNCKEEKDYKAHEYDDDCDDVCNVCHYERDAKHIYDGWQSDEVEHWMICTVCEKETEHEGHEPGPKANDERAQLCTVCEYELVPIQEHFHDFGNDWVKTVESHWQECKCGELSVPEPHVWDAGVENRKDDTITYSCTVCGAERTEQAPSSGFPWIVVFILLALVCVGGIVAIVIILKRSAYDDFDD
ncbi:MAG: hypothetical protein IJO21_02765 [Oscillospiraceae bacterium]|nr:hypothetical protein [Oscillospiraceae bacterium]